MASDKARSSDGEPDYILQLEHNQQQQQQQQHRDQQQQQHRDQQQQQHRDQQHRYQQQQQHHDQQQQQQLFLWYTPSSFNTPSQLLHLRFQLFLSVQRHFASTLSLLSLHPTYRALQQYSAIVGFSSQPQDLPVVFSDADPIAQSVLSSIVGTPLESGAAEVTLLDRLDLAEYLGDYLVSQTQPSQNTLSRGLLPNDPMVDITVSSLMQDTYPVAKLAFCSLQSLFQCLGPVPIPSQHICFEPIPYHSLSSAPIPFQRVVSVLQQHIYWIPSYQLNALLQRQTMHGSEYQQSHSQNFTCGSRHEVECFGVSCFPLQVLLQWYQMALAKSMLPHVEPSSDVWRLLRAILNTL